MSQDETLNRSIKDATVKRLDYDDQDQLRTHLADFMAAYYVVRRLKTLGGSHTLRIHLHDLDIRARQIILKPIHQMPGLNN